MMTRASGVLDIPLHNIFPSQHGRGWLSTDDNQIILSVFEYVYVYTCVCAYAHTCVYLYVHRRDGEKFSRAVIHPVCHVEKINNMKRKIIPLDNFNPPKAPVL